MAGIDQMDTGRWLGERHFMTGTMKAGFLEPLFSIVHSLFLQVKGENPTFFADTLAKEQGIMAIAGGQVYGSIPRLQNFSEIRV